MSFQGDENPEKKDLVEVTPVTKNNEDGVLRPEPNNIDKNQQKAEMLTEVTYLPP